MLQLGSESWRQLETVIRETARAQLPPGLDLDACRAIVALGEAIEARRASSGEEAQATVELIFAGYQRAQFTNLRLAVMTTASLLMKHPPALVAMMADPEAGIASGERYPPTLEKFATTLKVTGNRVLLACSGARRALGVRQSWLEEVP